jgi:hypothetical protein
LKKLKVPEQNLQQESLLNQIELLKSNGAIALIDEINWKIDFPKYLPVSVHIAHDNNYLFLLYHVKGEILRTVNNKDFMPVWEDSCVEFFMQLPGEKIYRNFECNANGVLLAAKRESRETAKMLSVKEISSIVRYDSIQHRYQEEKELSDWSLYLKIPKQVMGFSDETSLSGKKIKANFYKCGDKTEEPHFLSWNPINTPQPDFHVPSFFGLLEMA